MPKRRHGTPPSPFRAGPPGDGRRGAQFSEFWLARWPAGGNPRSPVPWRGSPRTSPAGRAAWPRLPGRPAYRAAPPTWPPRMSFMFMAFLAPLPFSFLFFFFLQQHFLQMQKQQVSSRRPVTTAIAISAQGGTAHGETGSAVPPSSPPPLVETQIGSAHHDAPCAPAVTTPMGPSQALLRRDCGSHGGWNSPCADLMVGGWGSL